MDGRRERCPSSERVKYRERVFLQAEPALVWFRASILLLPETDSSVFEIE